MLLCPNQITFDRLTESLSLSSKNYSSIDINNVAKVPLRTYLDPSQPFNSGEEPGSFAYVRKSNTSFVRNSCIDSVNFSNQVAKEIFLNPKYEYASNLVQDDVLLCKDANIGDACLFIPNEGQEYVFSSGVVRLNFRSPAVKYYCLAFLRDEYFACQLDAKTPKGSTIRHAGSLFLDCMVPKIGKPEEKLLPLIEALVRNIAYAERASFNRREDANAILRRDFLTATESHDNPTIGEVKAASRLDAGYYSRIVRNINNSLASYRNGVQSLYDAGFSMKRGPNLQKRDLGRSVVADTYKSNYHVLVYPSDISDNGYLLRETFIGARNPVWYMKSGDILFAAEGTVGKVFVICDEKMKFITNIHGLIISPRNKSVLLNDSIVLGQYLHFLRSIGYFDMVSVGGQGGSFAVNYWSDFAVPKFDTQIKESIARLYHSGSKLRPETFSTVELNKAGVFELNQFRITCQQILKRIVSDIKNTKTQSIQAYV